MLTDTERAVECLYTVGFWLLEAERYPDAVHVFRAMMKFAPDDERAWVGLATCHERRGESEVALKLYVLANQAVPVPCRVCLAQARLLRERGADDLAEQAYERAEENAARLGFDDLAEEIATERTAA